MSDQFISPSPFFRIEHIPTVIPSHSFLIKPYNKGNKSITQKGKVMDRLLLYVETDKISQSQGHKFAIDNALKQSKAWDFLEDKPYMKIFLELFLKHLQLYILLYYLVIFVFVQTIQLLRYYEGHKSKLHCSHKVCFYKKYAYALLFFLLHSYEEITCET